MAAMNDRRFNWLEERESLRGQVVDQKDSDCCWAIVCAYCVSSRRKVETNNNDPDSGWLAAQDLIDYVIHRYRYSNHVGKNRWGQVGFDKYGCYTLRPKASLLFAREYGIRFEEDYPFIMARNIQPAVRNPDDHRVYITEYTSLGWSKQGLTEETAYAYLRGGPDTGSGGPMMGTVRATKEFRNFKGRGIIKMQGRITEKAHSVSIIGMDRDIKCYRIQNSQGIKWGDEGEAWIRYDLVFDILVPGPTSLHPTIESEYPTPRFTLLRWFGKRARAHAAAGGVVEPGNYKSYSRDILLFLFILLLIVSAMTSLKKHQDMPSFCGKALPYLNRHQTEEWKGCTQVSFLLEIIPIFIAWICSEWLAYRRPSSISKVLQCSCKTGSPLLRWMAF